MPLTHAVVVLRVAVVVYVPRAVVVVNGVSVVVAVPMMGRGAGYCGLLLAREL